MRQRLTSWAATIVQAETQNVVRMSRSASTAAETKDGHPDQLGAAADITPRGAADAADGAGEARKTQSRTVDTARGEKAGHLRIENVPPPPPPAPGRKKISKANVKDLVMKALDEAGGFDEIDDCECAWDAGDAGDRA